MAKIHSIACPISAEGARRLSSSLIAMVGNGVDPGSRGPQIRSLGLSLKGLIEDLRSQLAQIGGSDEFPVLSARVERIACLAALARSYDGDRPEQIHPNILNRDGPVLPPTRVVDFS